MPSRRPAIPGLALGFVCLVAGVVFVTTASLDINPYDEGLILYGASRVLHGDVPYRDFWTLYGPGSFYLTAGLFGIFGESVAVGRGLDMFVRLSIVALAFLLAARSASRWIAWVAVAAVVVLLAAVRQYQYPIFPALALSLLALWLLDRAVADPRARAAAFLGAAAAGAATLVRHDMGLCAAIACAVLLALQERRGEATPEQRRRLRRFAVAGFAASLVPAALALLVVVPGVDLYEDLIRIPAVVYGPARSLPWPAPALARLGRGQGAAYELVVYMPFLAIAGCVWLAWTGRRAVAATDGPRRRPLAVALLVLAALLVLKGIVRVSPLHMAPAIIVAVVAFAVAAPLHAQTRQARIVALVIAILGLLPLMGSAGFVLAEMTAGMGALMQGALPRPWAALIEACAQPAVPRLRCATTAADRVATTRFLLERAVPGSPVYVGAGRHDRLFASDVALYFLSATRASTRWHDLHPGLQTMAAVQRTMIDEFQRLPPAWVVLDTEWDTRDEPNKSRESGGVTLLDDYVHQRFAPVLTVGTFTVLAPRAGPSP